MKPFQLCDFKRALITALLFSSFVFLIPSRSAGANRDASGATPAPENLSTNWMADAKAALPARYQGRDLSFGQLTNLLASESRRGNSAAKGLWGIALVAQSHSPEEAAGGIDLLRGSAQDGDVMAMLNLGYVYENGRFSKTNYTEAFHWMSLAAEKGNAEAETRLGGYYRIGMGTAQDYSMAAKWYRRGADHHNYEAMKSLGYLQMNGLGEDQNLGSAKYWCSRAAKEGNRRAMFNMGTICVLESSNSIDSAASMAEAFRWYKQSADLGDPLAYFQVACFYQNGWGGAATNLDSYYEWLSKAANLGATEAQYFMGKCCGTGTGMPKDAEKSLEWYRKAAAKNEPRALYALAMFYSEDKTNRASLELSNDYMRRAAQAGHCKAQLQYAMNSFRGDISPQDCERGKEWLAKSAENGWAKAEVMLFQFYSNEKPPSPGCPPYPKDPTEALKWLRRAAEHEDLQAEAVFAVAMIRGKYAQQNKPFAEKFLRNAATHGDASAQNDLGYAILSGATAKKDLVEAAVWSKLAEIKSTDTNLTTHALSNFSDAASHLTADQLSEVDRRVKAFQPLPVAEPNPMAKDWEKDPAFQPDDNPFSR